MGGSVLRLDIPHDAVSFDCNIKSARGHTSIHTRVPKSGESTVQIPSYHSDMGTDSTDKLSNASSTLHPYRGERSFTAFVPALASLATIAVESIGAFLQKKCNKALGKGLKAIKSDQTLAWNSIKQLEDDFLLYGKYSIDSLEKIIHTINHLGDRVHQMEGYLWVRTTVWPHDNSCILIILEDYSLHIN